MTLSCREQVVAAVKTVLAGVTGIVTERNRRTDLAITELPRAILFEGNEETNDTFAGEDGFDLPLMVQVALNESGESGATSCNAMRAKLRQALLADRTLGGKARDLSIVDLGDWLGVGIMDAGGDSSSDDLEGFMLGLSVRYATVENDPFTFSN